MPPPDVKNPLSREQIQLLGQWIEQGARWQPHWSFVAPRRPHLPHVTYRHWPATPIDRFILRRLEAEGLAPSPEADKTRLIRRVTLDLTGLPPTIDQLDRFLSDPSADTYEKLVDRLLASPRYGEHMARYWLDVARYADTHGLHLDNERGIWRYRDWVIAVLNENMPFDQFTIEQLAGDLLPDPTLDQLIATGFNRCNVTTGEGGTIAEEFRVRSAVERVEITATVWLGLTAGCAVCHDHKFDPITQKEFYQLFAFFNQLSDKGTDGNRLSPPPVVRAPVPYQARRLRQLEAQIDRLRHQLRTPLPAADTAMAIWAEDWLGRQGTSSAAGGESQSPVKLSPWHVIGPFPAANFEVALRSAFPPEREIILSNSYNAGNLRWILKPDLVDGKVHKFSGNYSATYLYRTLEAPGARCVKLSLGSNDGIAVWLNGQTVFNHLTNRDAKPDQDQIDVYLPAGDNRLLVKLANFRSGNAFCFRMIDDNKTGLPEKIREIVAKGAEKRTESDRATLREYFRRLHWPPLAPVVAELDRSIGQLLDLDRQIPITMITQERPEARETFVLVRGQYDRPGEKVTAGVPAALPPLPATAPPIGWRWRGGWSIPRIR